jgi:polyisoprenoid-binding protein YceI
MAWVLDPAHTRIGFSARHMGLATVRGQFTRFEGVLEGDPSDITTATARIEVDLDSVETGDERRDQHLRSPDFFDVANYPTMTFVSKEITPKGDGVYRVLGDLTIKDATR